jgi:ribosomal protein L16 Arg81 hydroxylase
MSLSWSDGPEGVLHPTDSQTFLREHWDGTPLVIQGRDPAIYNGILSLDDLDRLLTTSGLRHPTFRLVKQGDELHRPSYTVGPIEWGTGAVDGFIGLEQVRAEMKQGATLVLEAVQRLWGPIAQLSRLFEQHFHCPAPVNLYCTPPGAQGFQPHFDVQNVFVLQLHGTKRWQVYTPHIERPVLAQAHHGAVPPGELLHEITLQPGDLLYLPRGYVHCAQTTDQLSVHVSVSLLPTTWADLFTELVQGLHHDDLFRQAISLQPEGPADADASMGEQFSHRMDAFAQGSDLEDALDAMGRRFVASRLPATRGQLCALADGHIVTASTRLAPHPGVIWRVDGDADRAHLHFHGKTVSAPWTMLQTLRWIACSSGFTVEDIPGDIDTDTSCTLVQHLLDEGFLQRLE